MAFGHESHLALIENFVDAIETGSPLRRVTGEDALKTHRFIDAILTGGSDVARWPPPLPFGSRMQERGRCCPRYVFQTILLGEIKLVSSIPAFRHRLVTTMTSARAVVMVSFNSFDRTVGRTGWAFASPAVNFGSPTASTKLGYRPEIRTLACRPGLRRRPITRVSEECVYECTECVHSTQLLDGPRSL